MTVSSSKPRSHGHLLRAAMKQPLLTKPSGGVRCVPAAVVPFHPARNAKPPPLDKVARPEQFPCLRYPEIGCCTSPRRTMRLKSQA
jgi:hypothetical protein